MNDPEKEDVNQPDPDIIVKDPCHITFLMFKCANNKLSMKVVSVPSIGDGVNPVFDRDPMKWAEETYPEHFPDEDWSWSDFFYMNLPEQRVYKWEGVVHE